MQGIKTTRRRCYHQLMGAFVGGIVMLLLMVPVVRASDAVVLAVHPYISASELHTRFKPLADRLAQVLDRPVIVSVSSDYEAHVQRVGKAEVDIAFMGPSLYVAATQTFGPQHLLARISVAGAPEFHGYVVVRTDDAAQTLADLKGRRVAFGDEGSTMSHLVPYAMLLQSGVKKSDLAAHAFLGGHKNVALAVLAGAYDAGAVKEEIYFEYKDKGLRALARSPALSEHLLLATSRLSGHDFDSIQETLFDLARSEQGRAALTAIKTTADGWVSVKDSDYDALRSLIALTRGGS